MINVDGFVIMETESGIALFSKLQSSIDENLFSGFLTAIRSFAKELSLGGVSSFTTDEKTIYLIARNYITVAIIAPNEISFDNIYSLGYKIGEEFEDTYNLSLNTIRDSDQYIHFNEVLTKLIDQSEIPFLIKTAEFAQKEFGGELSIQPQLKNRDGKLIKVDLVVDRGKKRSHGVMDHLTVIIFNAYSEVISFIIVIDGTAGRGEVLDFLDILKTFGKLTHHKENADEFPYFPAMAVIIANDFSPTVYEELKILPKFKGKANIPGTHVSPDAAMRGTPKSVKCFIELWKWHDNAYPERIFS